MRLTACSECLQGWSDLTRGLPCRWQSLSSKLLIQCSLLLSYRHAPMRRWLTKECYAPNNSRPSKIVWQAAAVLQNWTKMHSQLIWCGRAAQALLGTAVRVLLTPGCLRASMPLAGVNSASPGGLCTHSRAVSQPHTLP